MPLCSQTLRKHPILCAPLPLRHIRWPPLTPCSCRHHQSVECEGRRISAASGAGRINIDTATVKRLGSKRCKQHVGC